MIRLSTGGLALLVLACPSSAVFGQSAAGARDLFVTVGKSIIVDSPVIVERIAVANGGVAEALATTPREVLINGKSPGETSLIVWQQGGNRLIFDLHVRPSLTATRQREEAVRRELERELAGEQVTFTVENGNVFIRGTVPDLIAAERAVNILSTLGKPINLLSVKVPPVDPQILLKVRFAAVDRGASRELGVNFFSTGAGNTPGSVTAGTFSPPRVQPDSGGTTVTFTDTLNIFLFRRDLDLGATIRALAAKRLAQILAEPNVLAINGKSASFLAGGEFPFPTLQGGGGGLGAVTIQFREFGIRLNFTPTITPRDTIRLQVAPEVSSLDYANSLTFQGFTIPGISTRRVTTEVELEDRQSFALAGLLDNRLTESLSKIPGIGDIPILGKLFQTQVRNLGKTELVVVITPEIVRPIPIDQPKPDVPMPRPFIKDGLTAPPRTPGIETTGLVPVKPRLQSMPVEQLRESQRSAPATSPTTTAPLMQFIPVPVYPQPGPPAQPQAVPPPAPPAAAKPGPA